MKKALGNFTVLLGLDLFLGLIIFVIWNTAATWIAPQLHSMSYLNGLGLATLYLLITYTINHWTNRIAQLRKIAALDKAMNTDKLALELYELKVKLKEKNIL